MNLVDLYNNKISIYYAEELIERSLLSISLNRLRNNIHSVVISLSNSKNGQKAKEFLTSRLAILVSNGSVNKITIRKRTGRMVREYVLIKPLVSKSSEKGKDTFIFFKPDEEEEITVSFIARSVQINTKNSREDKL